MNKTLAEIIEQKDRIIEEVMVENKYLKQINDCQKREVERLKYYEELIRDIKDDNNKDCWGR